MSRHVPGQDINFELHSVSTCLLLGSVFWACSAILTTLLHVEKLRRHVFDVRGRTKVVYTLRSACNIMVLITLWMIPMLAHASSLSGGLPALHLSFGGIRAA